MARPLAASTPAATDSSLRTHARCRRARPAVARAAGAVLAARAAAAKVIARAMVRGGHGCSGMGWTARLAP